MRDFWSRTPSNQLPPSAYSNIGQLMSALGQKRTLWKVCAMSALPPKADVAKRRGDVRFVPKADIGHFIRLPDRR
jgi:hypothetical protein